MDYLDSNIWLYATMATEDAAKRQRSLDLIENKEISVSLQVVNEVTRVLSKKGGVSEEFLRSVIGGFYSRYEILQLDEPDIMKASELRERYQLSFWDSLHVSAALKAGATILFSEDMHSGLVIDGVLTIKNPFED